MDQLPGNLRGGAQRLFQKHQQNSQGFCKSRLPEFFAAGIKQGPKGSGVLVHSPGKLQHGIAAAHHGGMGDQGVIGTPLTFFGKVQKRLGHFEEHLNVPSALIGHDDLLIIQGDISGQQGQPLLAAPVPDEHYLCRHGDVFIVLPDLDHDRGENLCAALALADLPVDGGQMEFLPLVAIEDLLCAMGTGLCPFLAGKAFAGQIGKRDSGLSGKSPAYL